MLPLSPLDRLLVCLSPINWDEVWEGPQEISSRFAAAGWQVIFVENIGARTPRFAWQDVRRIIDRVRRIALSSQPTTMVPEGVEVHTPTSLPAYRLSWLQKVNRSSLSRQIRRRLNNRSATHPVIWTYNPSLLAQQVCQALNPRLLVYCCVHDFATMSPQHARLAEEEEQLMESADLVFVLSHKLFAAKKAGRQNVFLLPQCANLQHYLNAYPRITELASLPRPIIGYIGTIHQWVDQPLLKFAALAKPGWTFVLVGPERVSTAELRRLSNVVFLGAKEHDQLPAYVADFDAGIVPYTTDTFAQTIRPNKVLEYLVMGKPVVTTRLPELEGLQDQTISTGSPQEFVEAIEAALANDSPARRAKRREVAMAHSMEGKFAEIEDLLLTTLSQG